jgi:hypothetical protein
METLGKFMVALMQPGNWPFLVVFALVTVGLAVFLAFWITAYLKQEKLNLSHKFGSLWVHVTGGPDDPRTQPRPYRKLLYVKVNFLANRKTPSRCGSSWISPRFPMPPTGSRWTNANFWWPIAPSIQTI